MASRASIAATLREIARYVRAADPSSFRGRAYERGAAAIEAAARFDELAEAGRLAELPGIGESLASVIGEIRQTGGARMLERLRAEVPRAVVELSALRGVDPEKARRLHDALGVETIDELEAACREGRLRGVKGYGTKAEERMLKRIDDHRRRSEKVILANAEEDARDLEAWMAEWPGAIAASIAGDVRRAEEIVGSLDLVVASNDVAGCLARLRAHARAGTALAPTNGETARISFAGAPSVRIDVVAPERFGWTLLRKSAAPAHAAALERRARERGVELAALAARSEADVYDALDLPYLPPEVREGADELELAAAGDDFADLVRVEDIRGAVHCHTTDSDGRLSIAEMADAARALGLAYITITDHSQTAHYAGGLDVERLARQREAIARASASSGIAVLAGTESDILPDGSLDFPMETLRSLDVVIGSIHARNAQDEGAMTARLTSYMRQPLRKIWGHPLGRLLLLRDPIACRLDEILDAAKENDAVIEINGDPHRMDMPPAGIVAARKRGLSFVVSSDAHSGRGIGAFRHAVALARKGGLRRKHVLNALDAGPFAAAVRPIR